MKTSRANMLCAVTFSASGKIMFSAYFSRINEMKKGDLVSFAIDEESEPLIVLNDPDGFPVNVHTTGYAHFNAVAIVKQLVSPGIEGDWARVRYLVSKEAEEFQGLKVFRIITKSALVS
jgi:hypothetical protein